MEATIILRGKAQSKEHADIIRLMLSDDPPIFEAELDPQWHYVFAALESMPMPESRKRIGKNGLQFSWLVGGNYLEELAANIKNLSEAGLENQVGYYWADEDEGFVTSDKNIMHSIPDWRSQVGGVKSEPGTGKWIDSSLTLLSKAKSA
ncbi:MAG: hypothetical protein PVJ72_16155 [Gammaproteobacteria bacterium]|jgi:hypothetical protein